MHSKTRNWETINEKHIKRILSPDSDPICQKLVPVLSQQSGPGMEEELGHQTGFLSLGTIDPALGPVVVEQGRGSVGEP